MLLDKKHCYEPKPEKGVARADRHGTALVLTKFNLAVIIQCNYYFYFQGFHSSVLVNLFRV